MMKTATTLHDAVLDIISFDWKSATGRITFTTSEGEVGVELRGVAQALCPRRLPWGPSNSVNEVRLERVSNREHLQIEMQSGDTLVFDCEEVLGV